MVDVFLVTVTQAGNQRDLLIDSLKTVSKISF